MNNEQNQVPGLTDKRIAPPGILPKNTQTLLLGGLAVVMVIVIVFSSRSGPKPRNSTAPGAETMIDPPNEEKLKDYPQRIEEEAQKLKKEQAELARAKTNFVGAT